MRKITYILFVVITLVSCKKKVFENNILVPYEGLDYIDCNCPSLDFDIDDGDGQLAQPDLFTVYDATNHLWPQINPNNADEIAFVSIPYGNGQESQLIIYNTITQEKRVLVNEWITGQISWGKKDWILFKKAAGLQLYKIKSNGDSLTPIGNGQWFHASWNSTGDKFIAFHKFKSTLEPRTFILNVNGDVLDSIYSDWWYHDGNSDWSHPEYYLKYDAKNIYIMDLEANKVIKKIKAPFLHQNGVQNGIFGRVGWHSYNTLLFYGLGGLYKYDLTTDKVTHIRCWCGSSIFGFTHAFDFSKVVLQRTEIQLIENNQKHFIDNKLFLLNPITLEEEEIIIP